MLFKYTNKWKFSFSIDFTKILIFFLIILFSACSVPKFAKPKKVNTRETPANAKERARKNVEEGRAISLKGAFKGGNRSTNYEFSTSNPLWRASLDTLDFMPLTTVNYSGGIIITDWYSDSNSSNESIKITVRFLSNEVQSNSLKVIVHNKKCGINENCTINEIDSKIKFELQKTIISKAAQFEIDSKSKKK
jgi:hypothetical protein